MNDSKSSRRAFFLRGGAVLGAGVAATAGAATLTSGVTAPPADELEQLKLQLACAEDREAVRQLHLAFTALVESQRYEAVADLFDEQAQLNLSGEIAAGRDAIRQLFSEQYRGQKAATLHGAYRQGALQAADVVTIGQDRLQAAATFHVEVELSTPLRGDSTLVTMSRLQGHVADRRWEAGRFEAQYVKRTGHWKMASLNYLPA